MNICYDSKTLMVMTCNCCPNKNRCGKYKQTITKKTTKK